MILLVSSSCKAVECAAAIERGTHQPTRVASTVPDAIRQLRCNDYEAVALDQCLLEMDPAALDRLLNHARVAMPIYINLALQRADRIVREVQEGLRRASTQKEIARRAAEDCLRGKLREDLTGILLSSELALRQPLVPAAVAEKIRSVQILAEQMRTHLQVC